MAITPQTPTKDPKAILVPKFMPFFWLSVSLLAGILAARLFHLSWMVWLAAASFSLAAWLIHIFIKRDHGCVPQLPWSVILLFFFIGGMRWQLNQPVITPVHSAYYNERGLVEIVGVVIAPPEVYDGSINLTVKIESLLPLSSDPPLASPGDIYGRLILQVLPGNAYVYGDRLSIQGKLQTPPDSGDFSYQDYLANKGIYSLVSYARVERLDSGNLNPILAAVYSLREHAQLVLRDIFPSPESELLSGILLGNDNGLSEKLKSAYQVTGTAHIIAISGFNIALLAGLITAFSNRWLGPWRGTLATILILAAYTILVGAQASVVRAAVMGSLGMLGVLIGQRGNGLNTLGLAALGMCLVNPNLPWDVGFQLSFFATLGLVLYASPLRARLQDFLGHHMTEEKAARVAGPLSEYFLFTLIAQSLTLPLIAFHFGDLSWFFLIANPLILPAQPPLMIFGGLALLGGLMLPAIGRVLAWLAWPFAAYTNRVVEWLAGLAPASVDLGHISFGWVLLYYVLFFGFTLAKDKKALFKRLVSPVSIIIILACAALITWALVFSAPDGLLTLSVLPGSDNPVVLIETPFGRHMLINGSVKASSLREALGKRLPLARQELDLVVIPLCRRDDVSALVSLQEFIKIRQVAWACDPDIIQTTRQLYQSYQNAGIPQIRLTNDSWMDLGSDARLTMLEGGKDASVFSLDWATFRSNMIFGDIQKLTGNCNLSTSVLVLPGSTDLGESALFAQLNMQLVIAAVQADNLSLDGSLPLADVFNGIQLLRTDYSGMITLGTDGQQMWINARQ